MKKIITVLIFLIALNSNVFAQTGRLSAWAKNDAEEAAKLGISDISTEFDKPITRREFCHLAVLTTEKWDAVLSGQAVGFSDTDDEDVLKCASAGIVSGMGGGKFCPDAPITREQAAVMLYNTLNAVTPVVSDYKADDKNGVNGIFLPHVFNDGVKIHNWSRNEIYAVYHLGIMMGNAKNEFEPEGSYTKEQAVCTFLRLYNTYKKPESVQKPESEFYPSPNENIYADCSTKRYYLNAAYQWGDANYKYEPIWYDGFGNSFTSEEMGYVYPVNNKYMEVSTVEGVGVGAKTIIDKNCNEPFGSFYEALISSDYNDIAALQSYGTGVHYNTSTGQKNDIPYYPAPIGCKMYEVYDNGKIGCLNENFDMVIPCKYKTDGFKQRFLNDLCVFQRQDNSFDIVNTKGEVLKNFKLNLEKYSVESILGTNLILQTKNSSNVLYRAYSEKFITIYDSIDFLKNGEMIGCKNGNKYFLDLSGNVLANLTSLGYDDLQYIEDGNYFIVFKINSKNWSRVLPYDIMDSRGNIIRRGIKCLTVNGNECLKADSSGISAYMADNKTIIVYDSFGKDIGTIKTQNDIINFDFINGLIRVKTGAESNSIAVYYTPDGKAAITNAVKN